MMAKKSGFCLSWTYSIFRDIIYLKYELHEHLINIDKFQMPENNAKFVIK